MTREVFFFGASAIFVGAPLGGGGRFLEEIGGMEEEDKVGWVDIIFERLGTPRPHGRRQIVLVEN